jgi:hypothetical protein
MNSVRYPRAAIRSITAGLPEQHTSKSTSITAVPNSTDPLTCTNRNCGGVSTRCMSSITAGTGITDGSDSVTPTTTLS